MEADFDLLETIEFEGNIHSEELKKAWSPLSKEFADGLDDEHLHIVVRCPLGTCNCLQIVAKLSA